MTKDLNFFAESLPQFGTPVRIAPDIIWISLPLPYRLNHVNVYVIDDGKGIHIIDTGLNNDLSRRSWINLLRGPLADRRVESVVATHHHPDHVGLAGWLVTEFDAPLLMTATDYFATQAIQFEPVNYTRTRARDFYLSHQLDADSAQMILTRNDRYKELVTPIPQSFRRLTEGDELRLGRYCFRILTGAGHAPEQAMLYCERENVFFAADQVLAQISPNVSVTALEPDGNPLALYLRSLERIKSDLPAECMVLPGHHIPFRALHFRLNSLLQHHDERCQRILEIADIERSAGEITKLLFNNLGDTSQFGFAFTEVLAHLNYLKNQNALRSSQDNGGVIRFQAVR